MQLLISCCLIYLFNQGWSLFSHTLLRCSSIIWLAANNPSYRDACVLNSLILFLFSSGIQQSSISRPLHLKFRELLTDIATFDQKINLLCVIHQSAGELSGHGWSHIHCNSFEGKPPTDIHQVSFLLPFIYCYLPVYWFVVLKLFLQFAGKWHWRIWS